MAADGPVDLPLVAGVGGGVGTSTVARAVGGRDLGIYRGGTPVDIIVARATMWSLGCAQRALAAAPAPAPLLAVVADQARVGLPRIAAPRLRMTEGQVSGIVLMPFVGLWRSVDNPHGSAAGALTGQLLAQADTRETRAFAAAAGELAGHLEQRLADRRSSGYAPGASALVVPARALAAGPAQVVAGRANARGAVAAGPVLTRAAARAALDAPRDGPAPVVGPRATSTPGRTASVRR